MGRRSRKRASGAGTTRAERDAARRQRAATQTAGKPRGRRSTDERPPAPWGKFPLVELLVLSGILLMVWGLISWNDEGNLRFGAGLAIASLGGLELSVREHFAGYRSHTTLLSGVAAFLVVSVIALTASTLLWVLLVIAAMVFAASFYALRRVFQQRSGGLSFR
jgi:hypothetical protein